ncbi:Armadillo-like helical domain-containing protein 3 [Nymphon striatum]|nr:Armadillo-like helical domain-containing protein 3 [Nymphon striatum]
MMLKTKFFITQSQVEDVEDFSELGGHLELAKLAAKDPETSDFVLAKLTPINSSKEVHYVGQITEVSTDEGETSYEVEFYRQSRKVCGRFIKPDVEDNCKIMGKTAAKKAFKEKIILSYDKFFKGENPSVGNPDFWNELFLLKANVSYIENEFDKLSGDQVLAIKENINLIFYHCVKALEDDRQIRVVNAIQTLCALVRGVYKKTNKDYGFDIINVLVGFDSAENVMQCLIGNLNRFLTQDTPVSLKSFMSYIHLDFCHSSYPGKSYLTRLLVDSQSRIHHGSNAVLLLTILVNYRKYESANPYIVNLSILDNELALNGYGQVVSAALADFNRKYCSLRTEPTNSGFFSTITNMVGNMFVSDESGNIPKVNMRINDAILLALYEAIHLNRNFITTLTHSQTSASCPPSPVLASTLTGDGTQNESSVNNTKLAFIILTCIAEDQYANSLMHDVNMVFRVKLHKMPMRHRKTAVTTVSSAEPLACAVLNLMVEFVISHMKKNFPIDLFVRCLGVIHRILCYQKRCRVRLNYEWKELWSSLINLLKFLLAHETHLVKKCNIFQVSDQIINILNLFITFGDTFLPKPTIYDALYYEIIRIHIVFDNLYSMALRYSTNDGEYKGTASKLTNSLVNIRAIINHFSPKIDKWSTENQQATLTESQVLEVVQSNYDTLTLKLHDNLDQYERYSEKPKEVQFFTQLIRSVVSDFRKNLCFTSLEQQSVLQEFSSIS